MPFGTNLNSTKHPFPFLFDKTSFSLASKRMHWKAECKGNGGHVICNKKIFNGSDLSVVEAQTHYIFSSHFIQRKLLRV